MGVLLRLVALTCACLLAFSVPAQAHYMGLEREVSEDRARKVSSIIHKIWENDDKAHKWQSVVSCESKYRKYARNGQYLGLAQLGSSARAACDWPGDWNMLDQLRAARCWWHRNTGWSAWSCA